MKPIIARTFLFLALPLVCLHAGSSDARITYEKALALEEASGRLSDAIALFQKVVAQSGTDQALAAQAQLHVGICYEKLARKEARQAYQAVLEKYPSQHEAVRIARERLTRLSDRSSEHAMIVREFVPGVGKHKQVADLDPSAFEVSRDGSIFAYTDWGKGDLVVYDAARDSVQRLYGVDWVRSTDYYMSPVLSADGRRIAFLQGLYPGETTFKNLLAVDSIRGGSYQALYETKLGILPHDWSPDGKRVLAVLEAEDRSVSLVTVGVGDKTLRRLVTLNWDYPIRARYSPDGRWIAYDSTKGGERKIYLLGADGLVERLLVDSAGQDDSPVWSPDGRSILYRSNRSGEWDLFAVRIDERGEPGESILIKANIGELSFLRGITRDGKLFYGEQLSGPGIAFLERGNPKGISGAKVLPKFNTRESSPAAFSPDRKTLAYLVGQPYGPRSNQVLRIASLDGKPQHELPLGPEYRRLRRPAFSPDGKTVALSGEDRKREGTILVVSAETGKLLKAIPSGHVAGVGWSPDGRVLHAVVRHENRRLDTIDIDSGRVSASRELPVTQRTDDRRVGFSPDGRWLALLVASPRGAEITKHELVIHSLADGTNRVFPLDAWVHPVVWDSDSKHLFVQDARRRILRLSASTGAHEGFLGECRDFTLSAVSPDGRMLALATTVEKWRIWTIENFLPARKDLAAAR